MSETHEDQIRYCLLLHGFTGGPDEVEPLAIILRQQGYRTIIPTLPGHADMLRDLGKVNWQDWVQAAEQEAASLAAVTERFDLVGFSMGGVIAAYLASRYPVRRLVLLNAAAIYVSPVRYAKYFAAALRQKQAAELLLKKRVPLGATWQFVQLVKHLRYAFGRVTVPTLIAQSGSDQIVNPHSARYLQRRIKGPATVCMFPQSRHLICQDVEAEQLFAKVTAFFLANGED